MTTVKQLLRDSTVADVGPVPAPRLPPDAALNQATQMMARARRGAVVIVDGMKPVGIFTERDVLNRLNPGQITSAEERTRTLLSDVMTSPVTQVRRRVSLREAVALMSERGHRHLVVVDRRGQLLGLLTSSDIIHYLTDHFPEDVVNLPPHLHQTYPKRSGG